MGLVKGMGFATGDERYIHMYIWFILGGHLEPVAHGRYAGIMNKAQCEGMTQSAGPSVGPGTP